jgi:type IV secretory pathway TraG/TraD family ATPase VirD4
MPPIFDPSRTEWLLEATVWWRLFVTCTRIAYCVLGRAFGFYAPEHYRYFTWAWVPWRTCFLRFWLPIRFRLEERHHGRRATARLAGYFETAAHLYRHGYIPLGRFRPLGIGWLGFQPIGMSGAAGGHLAMFGKTGGYKTTQVITLLGLHCGNAFVIDPKGQIAKVLAPAFRAAGKKVCILDPTGQVRAERSHRWSPWTELRRAEERALRAGKDPEDAVVALATTMVEGLVVRYPKDNPFWPGAAKDLLLGLVLWMYVALPLEGQTLEKLYSLLTIGLPEKIRDPQKETGFMTLIYELSRCHAFGDVIAQSVSSVSGGARETTANLMFTIREQLKWLKRPALRKCSAASDFDLEELKTGNLILFVCAKLEDIRENFPGWLRLLTVMALSTFEDVRADNPAKTLFILDEFASIGKIDRLEVASNYARSAGIRLFTILQDIGQIAGGSGAPPLYDNWETFIGNTECCWWLNTSHQQTLLYMERKFGKRTIKTRIDGPPAWWFLSGRPRRYDYRDREVMTANQIESFMSQGNMLVTRGLRAFKLKPEPYFKSLPVWRYQADPDFRETFPRACLRQLIKAWQKRQAGSLLQEMTFDDACNLYGLCWPFSRSEVQARLDVLMVGEAARTSPAFGRAIDDARQLLLRRLDEEERESR